MWGPLRVHFGAIAVFLILYISDSPIHTTFHVTLFADDTVLLTRNKNINKLQELVNHELRVIDDWLKCNRLSLNYTKINFYVRANKHNSKLVKNFNVAVGKHDIQSFEKVKYLGAIFDKNLSWNAHVDNMIKKLAFASRIFSTIRHYANKKTLINLYYSFADPSISYIKNFSMGQCKQNFHKKLQIMQNKIIHIINFKHLNDNVNMCIVHPLQIHEYLINK